MTEKYFSWHVAQNGMLFLGCAIFSIIGFVILTIVNRFTGDRLILVISSLVMCVGYVLLALVPLPMWRFLLSAAIVALALPCGQALTASLITKMIPKTHQGIGSGLRDAAGTLSRIVGPLWANAVFLRYGSFYVFIVCAGMIAVSAAVQVLAFKWLVPLHKPAHHHAKDHESAATGAMH